MSVLWIALGIVVLQRLATLARSRRNAPRMLERGGIETARFQFPLIAALQAAWIAAMALSIPPATHPTWWLLGVAAIALLFHTWAIVTLHEFWTTRVILVPQADLVRGGPYRLLRHPAYVAVLVEIVVVPAAFHAYAIAAAFAVLYAALIVWRVRDEDRLLAPGRAGRGVSGQRR